MAWGDGGSETVIRSADTKNVAGRRMPLTSLSGFCRGNRKKDILSLLGVDA